MPFHSILFAGPCGDAAVREASACFADLNLDQLFAVIAAGREAYDLEPYFSTPLRDAEGVVYRQEVLRDLRRPALREPVTAFARRMDAMREHLVQAGKLYHDDQKASWFLDAVEVYCDAASRLASELSAVEIRAPGLLAFREHVRAYVRSDGFTSLAAATRQVKNDLLGVTYALHIKGRRITVTRYRGEPDYSAEVEGAFQKFRQGAVRDYRVAFHDSVEMNPVEGTVLDLVARLHPEPFLALRDYRDRHDDYLDPTIRRFDREVQFYLAYLELMERVEAAGLSFCYPEVAQGSKEEDACDTFDLALAERLVAEGAEVVCNDFRLQGPERILVVSGPNQGGKTTFARTFGQLHYLAKLGLAVPGRRARLMLCDRVFTHFDREEHLDDLRGKLQDELLRIHEILRQATSDSVVVMNESFASTTLRDALFLGREVLRRIIRRDALCVYVTFLDELSALGEATVSMVSTVVPDNPALRTYKVERRPADGLAYAAAIARKYGLTYASLGGRIRR